MANVKRVKKKKLNIKALILLLLIIYLIIMFLYTIFTMPIKNIYINNTSLISDNEIIEIAGIKNYPSLFKINAKKLEKKISEIELVESVNIKKNLNGKLIINIKEAKPLFLNRTNNKIILSNKKEVEPNNNYLGIPSLINNVPSDLLNDFIDGLSNVETDIIGMINEIEYNPHIEQEQETGKNIVINERRFILRMNDTNTVHVDTLYIERLNDYKSIMMTIKDDRGVILLDSDNSQNGLIGLFTSYKDLNKDKETGENSNGSSTED